MDSELSVNRRQPTLVSTERQHLFEKLRLVSVLDLQFLMPLSILLVFVVNFIS